MTWLPVWPLPPAMKKCMLMQYVGRKCFRVDDLIINRFFDILSPLTLFLVVAEIELRYTK